MKLRTGQGILAGLQITARHLLRPTITIQYPEEMPPIPDAFRARHDFVMEDCTSCGACVRICPVGCISLKAERGPDKKLQLHDYRINFVTCLFCGLCTEACPTHCLTMGHDFEFSGDSREELVLDAIQMRPVGMPLPESEKVPAAATGESQGRSGES